MTSARPGVALSVLTGAPLSARQRRLWLYVGALFVVLLGAVPRLAAVTGMTTFIDEILWLRQGTLSLQKLSDGPITPEEWGPELLQHPGVPVAIAGALADLSRDPTGDRVTENERIIASARHGIVWTGVLACLLVALLGARLYDVPTGLLAGSVLAVSPFHIANSAWLQADSALTTFSIGSVLTLLIRHKGGGVAWLLGSAALAGLAVASKLPGVVLAPFAGLVLCAAVLRRVVEKLEKPWQPLRDLACWLLVALATLYVVWPRMWLNPLELWHNIEWGLKLGHGHLNYFLGRMTTAPPWYYYLVIVPFRLSTIELIGSVAAVVLAAGCVVRRGLPRTDTLLLAAWGLLFLLAMSISGKKLGARYVLPLWPVMALMVARFVVVSVRPRLGQLDTRAAWGIITLAASAALGGAAVELSGKSFNYHAHANRLLGGLAVLDRVSMVAAIAERDVARYLDTLPASARVRVTSLGAHNATVQWHARRPLEALDCNNSSLQSLSTAPPDYLVVFSYQSKRCPPLSKEALVRRGASEIRTFTLDGVSLAHVYRFDAAATR